MLRLLFIVILIAVSAPVSANIVSDMRVVGDSQRTRFVVDLDSNPDFGLLRLTNPNRLVIDMPDVEFAEETRPESGRGLISDYRFGLIAPGKARIVLDLNAPVEIVSTFVLDAVSPEPARLVLDLAPTSPEEFEAAALEDRPEPQQSTGRGLIGGPRPSGDKPVVAIDPGHGGIDAGATGSEGLLEKDVTLRFGLELARQLEMGGELEPVLTREGDEFLSLMQRVEVARRQGAALFVSIHADTVEEEYVRGATVYTLSDEASDALAEAVAERDNRSDILAGLPLEDQSDEVTDILLDLTRRETKNLSIRLAKDLIDDMDGEIPLNSNPWRRASFRVLTAPDIPSVLLELGYLSNPEDEAMFKSEEWPAGGANVIARALEDFLGGAVAIGQAGQ